MHSDPPPVNPPPVNPLPPVVWALFFLVAGVELTFQAGENGIAGGPGAIGWRVTAVRDYAFSGVAFDWMVQNGRWPSEHIMRFFTYPFVHGSITAVAFSGVMLLALGKLVGEAMGQLAVVALFFGASFFGACVYGLLTNDEWLLGAFPGVYGLIGGYTYLMWVTLGARGQDQKGAFSLIAFMMGVQLFFSVFFGTGPDWIADLSGFVCGFALSIIVIPGGWRRLVEKIRARR